MILGDNDLEFEFWMDFDDDFLGLIRDFVAAYDALEVAAPLSPLVVVCDNGPVR